MQHLNALNFRQIFRVYSPPPSPAPTVRLLPQTTQHNPGGTGAQKSERPTPKAAPPTLPPLLLLLRTTSTATHAPDHRQSHG